jgi:DHA2 family multidrug resistance protein
MASSDTEAAVPAPLTGSRLALAGFALALANFVVVLDITIANVSVPHISGSLAAAPSQGTWVITSYAISEAISVPLTGWLTGRFGAVRVFMTAMIGFGVFSLLCGLSGNLESLLIFRVFQGLCGGPIMPMSQTLMLRIFPRERAGAALGLWSMTTVVAPIAGPILGGLISDNWSWHWIFFINLPVVLFCLFTANRLLRKHETPTVRNPVDYIGLGLLVIWVAALQILLDKGREEDWFASQFIVVLAVVAAIGFIAFVLWELTDENPIVDLSVFRARGFTVGVIVQSSSYAAFFSAIVIVPLFLQTNLGYTATWAGYATAFIGVLAVIISPVAAGLVARVDVRLLICGGVVWLGLVSLLRTHWVTDMDFATIALPQFLQGLGMPFFFIGTSALALGAVRADQTASAAGIQNFLRTLAGAFATSLVTTGWYHETRSARAELVGIINAPTQTIAPGGQPLSPDQVRSMLERMVDTEAMTLATNTVFLWCTAIFAFAAMIVWLAPRPAKRVDLSNAH